MGLSLVTGPATEPVTTAEAKSHMRIDISDDDTLIDSYIAAARYYIEGRTRRALVAQTWDYTLEEFPTDAIELPIQPVSSVSYVNYVNSSGSTVSWADTSTSPETPYWTLTTDGPRSKIIPNYNLTWPTIRSHGNAITVRFVAGYSTLPSDIKQAVLLLVSHFYEMREPVIAGPGMTVVNVPFAVDALLSAYELRGF